MSDFEQFETRTVSIFGSSGSIGKQSLEVVRNSQGRFLVHALSVSKSISVLIEQAREFHPRVVVVGDFELAKKVRVELPGIEVRVGNEGLDQTASEADVALNAIVGFAGMFVTISALRANRRLALANKESLVAAGPIVRAILDSSQGEIIPVDSEHAAIHQCLRSGSANEVDQLLLTSSGGPFRTRDQASLGSVTKSEALAHPTWAMGPKITVDSSTLMNKALEVIEAVELFRVTPEQVQVVIHPESIVHSMVSFVDGSIIAQLSKPDMSLPIAYALGFPNRYTPKYAPLDFSSFVSLNFEPPRTEVFKSLGYAYEAMRTGYGAPTWLSAVNEVIVEAFLNDEFRWMDIFGLIESSMEKFESVKLEQPDDVIALDLLARSRCREVIHEWRSARL